MISLQHIFKWFRRGDKVLAHPYKVKVSPNVPAYVEMVHSSYWRAVAHLEAAQYGWGHLHMIRKVVIRKGTCMGCGGWAIRFRASPTGVANGWCEKTRIVIVSDSAGVMDPKLVTRMWAHALLQFCNMRSLEDRRNIIRKAGLGE